MAKQDFVDVDPGALASLMRAPPRAPRQPRETPAPTPKPKRRGKQERREQYSLAMRAGMRKNLAKLAVNADMTIRGFILHALKKEGLEVREDDLADLRKR